MLGLPHQCLCAAQEHGRVKAATQGSGSGNWDAGGHPPTCLRSSNNDGPHAPAARLLNSHSNNALLSNSSYAMPRPAGRVLPSNGGAASNNWGTGGSGSNGNGSGSNGSGSNGNGNSSYGSGGGPHGRGGPDAVQASGGWGSNVVGRLGSQGGGAGPPAHHSADGSGNGNGSNGSNPAGHGASGRGRAPPGPAAHNASRNAAAEAAAAAAVASVAAVCGGHGPGAVAATPGGSQSVGWAAPGGREGGPVLPAPSPSAVTPGAAAPGGHHAQGGAAGEAGAPRGQSSPPHAPKVHRPMPSQGQGPAQHLLATLQGGAPFGAWVCVYVRVCVWRACD